VPQTLDSIPFTAANQAFKIAPFFNKGLVYPLILKVFFIDYQCSFVIKNSPYPIWSNIATFIHLILTMSYELTGKLLAKYEIIQRKETFKTREFVIEKTDDINGKIITNYVKFQCVQDRTTMPDRFNLGDTVKVLFNIKGSKWNKDGKDNYITNLDAWRMEAVQLGGNTAPTETNTYFDIPANESGDDLPF
jgi:hypothetical protein